MMWTQRRQSKAKQCFRLWFNEKWSRQTIRAPVSGWVWVSVFVFQIPPDPWTGLLNAPVTVACNSDCLERDWKIFIVCKYSKYSRIWIKMYWSSVGQQILTLVKLCFFRFYSSYVRFFAVIYFVWMVYLFCKCIEVLLTFYIFVP